MGLVVYRSCTWREKREVLETFWRTKSSLSEKINQAALEYGPYATVCILVIAIELVPVIIYAVERSSPWAWLAVPGELLTALSLWRAHDRYRSLRAQFAATPRGENRLLER